MIYLDNAATTEVCKEAREAMIPYLSDKFGNPSAVYDLGKENRRKLDECRRNIALMINAHPENIIFTSGGTEADNMAIRNVGKYKLSHIITTAIEHHAVLDTCEYMEKMGAEVTYMDVDKEGFVNLDRLEKAIKRNTKLISIMFANNEIGTIEPVAKIGRMAKAYHIPFHTDAVQAFGHVPIDVEKMSIDMLSVSAHKFGGPKGTGFIYVRNPETMPTLIYGGGQEEGKRSGTENIAGIVGMDAAARVAMRTMNFRIKRERYMRDYLVGKILKEIEDVKFNGSRYNRLPGNANFSFKNANGARMVEILNENNVCISAGSACQAGGKPSHVIAALDMPPEYALGTIRITLSSDNTIEELDYTIKIIKQTVEEMRKD